MLRKVKITEKKQTLCPKRPLFLPKHTGSKAMGHYSFFSSRREELIPYEICLLYSGIESRIPSNFPFLCPLQLTKQGIPKYCHKSHVLSFSNEMFHLVLNRRQIIILKSSYTIKLLLPKDRDGMLLVD